MFQLPSPHGDKLKALLQNSKLPLDDTPRLQDAIRRYERWRGQLMQVGDAQGNSEDIVAGMVSLLDEYKRFIEIDLIFDSDNDFLYRQKGQIKLDNSIIEEFLPVLVTTALSNELQGLDLLFGPTSNLSSIRFESSIRTISPGGGITIRSKAQDFAIARQLFIRASHRRDFQESITLETRIAYVATEIKTNLDKTMFQEAAATASDVKSLIPGAKYYLLCEWLDMTPISTAITAIDEILILRRHKRIPSNIRSAFSTVQGRKQNRTFYEEYLTSHPFSPRTFQRFVEHIRQLVSDESEAVVLERGYF